MSRYVPIILVFLLLVSACAQQPTPVAEAEARAALEQRELSFLAALSARDLEQTTAYFAEDAELHLANMAPIKGQNAISQFYRNVFRFLRASEAKPERLHISGSADLAYSSGQVNNVFAGEQGQTTYTGKYLLVWVQQEGEWLIVFYSLSNNQGEGRR